VGHRGASVIGFRSSMAGIFKCCCWVLPCSSEPGCRRCWCAHLRGVEVRSDEVLLADGFALDRMMSNRRCRRAAALPTSACWRRLSWAALSVDAWRWHTAVVRSCPPHRGGLGLGDGQGAAAVRLEMTCQVKRPTIAPIRQVVSVPDAIDFSPSELISSRRSGAMVPSPPTMMPRLPKLAKPHIA
jgi:hypothetical protein